MSKVSVIIPVYNGKTFLEKCLSSLVKHHDGEIIVVDDNSTDGVKEMIENSFPSVKLLHHTENKGTSATRNTGAKAATGDVLLFSDCDIIFQEDSILELLKMIEDREKAVAVSRIIPDGEDSMDWNFGYNCSPIREMPGYFFEWFIKAGIFPNFFKKLATPFILHHVNMTEERRVDWVVESCFVVRKDVFDEVGGFDEIFFKFFEGPDLCRRIRDLDYEIWYAPKSVVTSLPHHSHSKKGNTLFIKSNILYHRKHSILGKSLTFVWKWMINMKNWVHRKTH